MWDLLRIKLFIKESRIINEEIDILKIKNHKIGIS